MKNHFATSLTPQAFQLAVEYSTDHITLSDPNGIVLYANQAVEKITGFSKEEAIGKKAGSKELWGGQMSQEFYTKLWDQIGNKKKPFRGVMKNKRKDGSIFFVSATIFPILNTTGDVDFFVEVNRDITREKEIEKSKASFLSYIGHKLRSPLTVVKWNLELLDSGDTKPELSHSQQKILDDIGSANESMIDIVGDLIEATRIEFGKLEIVPIPTDPSLVMKTTLNKLRSRIHTKQLHVHEDYAATRPLPLDPKILEAVFTIILSNAIKFTPKRGKITIGITADTSKDELAIEVSDTGIGIRPEDQPKIFTKFFRSRDAQLIDPQGTGIALTNAEQLITQSGGRIWFKSPADNTTREHPGASFYIAFPLSGMAASESL